MKKIVILFSVFLFFAGIINAQSQWTKETRKIFMKTCQDGVTSVFTKKEGRNYCSCAMQQVEQLYPNPADAGKLTEEQANKLAEYCMQVSGTKEAQAEIKSSFENYFLSDYFLPKLFLHFLLVPIFKNLI